MHYRNTEMKIDQFINYINEGKINLSPAFQRGHVWKTPARAKLVRNIVLGRPIPSIFLYKNPQGTKYSYNILDGKQRLESLILFIADTREDLKIPLWKDYFFPASLRSGASFEISLPGAKHTFRQLSDNSIRDFREYTIPTTEITLTDQSNLDEIINLFVDINQQGVAVKRFSIVKAMARDDKLLKSVFELIALQQRRGEDIHYRPKSNEFTRVLKTLTLVSNIEDNNAKVDRMWERLLEIALFQRTGEHRAPVDVLKRFIRVQEKGLEPQPRLTKAELETLRKPFRFLDKAYRSIPLRTRRLTSDQTHFYTMITSLIAEGLLDDYSATVLTKKLFAFARIIDNQAPMPTDKRVKRIIEDYLEESSQQTTHVSRRVARQKLFVQAIESL